MSIKSQVLSELSRLTEQQLHSRLAREREKLRQLRFDLASGKIKNVRQIRQTKKNIARILTILNSKRKNKKL